MVASNFSPTSYLMLLQMVVSLCSRTFFRQDTTEALLLLHYNPKRMTKEQNHS